MLSIRSGLTPEYPDAESGYSPDERYPEYRYGPLSPRPNPVYRAVRDCLAQAGLDRANLGTRAWNPLGRFVTPGSRVFVLCNFVQHALSGQGPEEMLAKCTHGSAIRPVIDYLRIAVGAAGTIAFGNAPLQSCRWDDVLRETGAAAVSDFYRSQGEAVTLCDLRSVVVDYSATGAVKSAAVRDSVANCVPVDLGEDSLLAGLDHSRFRVTNYNPDRTQAFHGPGRHVYAINRKVLEADVVVSVPKLKTHEKVGLTCALKGCVGAIGDKDCLAHHRAGSPGRGGDECASDPLGLLRAASALHDRVQRLPVRPGRNGAMRLADRVAQRVAKRLAPSFAGGWWGNDTAWRMSLDIARILAHYREGAMHREWVRPHLVFTDGVVGGEGPGPLRPSPVDSGVVSFADNPVCADYAGALLMGFEPEDLPIVREALRLRSLPLAHGMDETAWCDGAVVPLAALRRCSRSYRPAPGWVGKVEAAEAVPA